MDGSDRAGVSAPYNMALASTPQKVNVSGRARRGLGFPEHGRAPVDTFRASIVCDKLRLGAWILGLEPENLRECVWGCANGYVVKGRRRGHIQPRVGKAFTEARGVEGMVYFELRDDGLSMSRRLVVEFNPVKLDEGQWRALGLSLRALGVDLGKMWVDRTDGAIDYHAARRVLLLDDRQRLADHFGCGPNGPETERTGFRRGSRLKFQLYDKTAERRAKGVDTVADVTRFEVQVHKPTEHIAASPLIGGPAEAVDEAWRLDRLHLMPWQGGAVTVRCVPFHWLALADPDWRGFLFAARGLGMRYAIRQFREMGWAHRGVQRLVDCCVPVVMPAPDDVWRAGWGQAASEAVGKLVDAVAWAEAESRAFSG